MRKLRGILLVASLSLCTVGCFRASAITIDWGNALQTIDGFGASSAFVGATLTSAQMDFFYTSSGIGLSIIRIIIYPDLAVCETGGGDCAKVSSGATVAGYDLANARAAAARGATIIASEWSPPGSMKSNGSYSTGGTLVGNSTNYANLASIQASFVTLLTGTYGIPIYAISPQNEPDMSTSYESCTWTARQIHDYVPYLHAALASAGYPGTKIIIAEPGSWMNTYAASAMNDATVASEVGILASHSYHSAASLLRYSNITTQHQWQTEVSDFGAYDGSIMSGLKYATQIDQWLATAGVNAWLYWELSGQGTYTDNEALTDINGNVAKRAYAIGNWSKFVRPGWHMVGVRNMGRLLVTAFTNLSGMQSAIVIVNNRASAMSNQTFSVGTHMGLTVHPYVTSSTESLTHQNAVAVNNGTVTYTIPADSVVTLTNVQLD